MPELPEVETVARQLAPVVEGRRARRLVALDPKLAGAARDDLGSRPVRRVFRRGKEVVLELAPRDGGPPTWLAVHLRMTGRLAWAAGRADAAGAAGLRAFLELDRGHVRFVDVRRFGTLTWYPDPAAAPPVGLDPTGPGFTPDALAGLLRGSRQELKCWLLRQDRLVGLGNIYASEILHAARLGPLRAAGSLRPDEVLRLHAATRAILEAAILHCGTTFSDFADAHGESGGFQEFLRVYGREGEPCDGCGEPIRRIVQGQRSTYYCRRCTARSRRRGRS